MKKLFTNTTEYSKQRLDLMIRLWIIGAFFGAAVVVVEVVFNVVLPGDYYSSIPIHLPELLSYIGLPIGGGIVTYLIKSAMENINKGKTKQFDPIPNEYPDEP